MTFVIHYINKEYYSTLIKINNRDFIPTKLKLEEMKQPKVVKEKFLKLYITLHTK